MKRREAGREDAHGNVLAFVCLSKASATEGRARHHVTFPTDAQVVLQAREVGNTVITAIYLLFTYNYGLGLPGH